MIRAAAEVSCFINGFILGLCLLIIITSGGQTRLQTFLVLNNNRPPLAFVIPKTAKNRHCVRCWTAWLSINQEQSPPHVTASILLHVSFLIEIVLYIVVKGERLPVAPRISPAARRAAITPSEVRRPARSNLYKIHLLRSSGRGLEILLP